MQSSEGVCTFYIYKEGMPKALILARICHVYHALSQRFYIDYRKLNMITRKDSL
ncbi:hypothetical protein WAI453_002054 [Rhynchosporium graminicola]